MSLRLVFAWAAITHRHYIAIVGAEQAIFNLIDVVFFCLYCRYGRVLHVLLTTYYVVPWQAKLDSKQVCVIFFRLLLIKVKRVEVFFPSLLQQYKRGGYIVYILYYISAFYALEAKFPGFSTAWCCPLTASQHSPMLQTQSHRRTSRLSFSTLEF